MQEGVSAEARFLKHEVDEYRSEAPSQLLDWRDEVDREILEIRADCGEEGWDGYEARPVSDEATEGARELLRKLPEGIERPQVVPESAGTIAFEWDHGRDMLLSISIDGDELIYAGILGPGNSTSGEAMLSLGMPFEIEHALSVYFAKIGPDSE